MKRNTLISFLLQINTKAGFDLVPSIRSYHAVLDTCLAADHPQGIISTVNEIKQVSSSLCAVPPFWLFLCSDLPQSAQRKIAPDGPLFNAMICAMAHEGVQDGELIRAVL
eukprot:SAG31_NODE_3310_length_4435_cov_3.950876_4_plen_110_part_00